MQIIVALVALGLFWLTSNWLYQVVRKPSELFFPVSGTLYKSPRETWAQYAPIFRRHSTAAISPQFLAALAQVEGSGNPIVRTYWRWSWSHKPYEVYRPASSAVGMYQITDGTFDEARRLCIHDHRVVEDGAWDRWETCWFNSLYMRVIPSHAVEMTSAYLDSRVSLALRRAGIRSASAEQKQDLAAVIHLCGAGAGNRYAARGLRLTPGQRCGDHDVRGYLARVNAMKRTFASFG
ncbi:MAG TPA: transglycosylase SLT domain-containing protein [Povalibacter sp.]|nr:transglycosylase SLT domain-containing protein [Povalibacter sp.]